MISFHISSYTDNSGRFGSSSAQVQSLLDLAAQLIGQNLSSNVTLQVAVVVNNGPDTTSGTIATGGPATTVRTTTTGNEVVLRGSAAAEAITGQDANGASPEINLTLNPLFFNTSSAYLGTDAVPANRFDDVSVLMHEVTHGLGFSGFLTSANFVGSQVTASTSSSTTNFLSEYDKKLISIDSKPYFAGQVAEIVFGGAVPLDSSVYHTSSAALPRDAMNPVSTNGIRNPLSDTDLAMLRDLGLPVSKTLVSRDGHTFVPGVGATSVTGTSGTDTLMVLGARTGYLASTDGSSATLAGAITGTLQVQSLQLQSIERVNFNDGTGIALDIHGIGGQAYRLYQAAFNRTPDVAGLGYWLNSMDHGLSLTATANGFVGSPEFTATYGAVDDNRFVTLLYANVLHRAPDTAGLAFNLGQMATIGRAAELAFFSESPENQANLLGVQQKGMVYTLTA